MSLYARALPIAIALLAGASWSNAAAAQSTPAPAAPEATPSSTDTIRLTDEQRADIIENNTEERAAAARGELPSAKGIGRGIHGEVGVMVGSNGSHGIYGAAEVPLGDNAAAAVSFESSTYNYGRRR